MRETLQRLLSLLGPGVPADIDSLFDDEHYRYELYQSVLGAGVLDPAELLRLVINDPDAAMAQSMASDIIEAAATSAPGSKAFQDWANSLRADLESFPWLQQRLRERMMIEIVNERGQVPEDALLSASDWAQRRIASTTVDRQILEVLSSRGRTRHIRNQAASRLR